MPEHISQNLIELSKDTAPVSFGRVMDTATNPVGDVKLTEKAIGGFRDIDLDSLRQRWEGIDGVDAGGLAEESLTSLSKKKILQLALVDAIRRQTVDGDDSFSEVLQLEHALAPHYSEGVYKAALKHKLESLEKLSVVGANESAKSMLLDELQEIYDAIPGLPETLEVPSLATMEAVHDWLYNQFGDLMEYIDEKGAEKDTFDADELKEIFEMCISTTPALREAGWKVIIEDRQKVVISVYAEEKIVLIPEAKQSTVAAAKRLVIHEAFGHALRSAIAESMGNAVAQVGTAEYAAFEESFEIVLEQCWDKKYDASRGIDHYVAIGMAVTSVRSSDEISRIFKSIAMLQAANGDSINDAAIAKSESRAQVQVRRTFAGMMDMNKGVAHMKDIDYLSGINIAWKILNYFVENNQIDEGMRWLLSGKFNPFVSTDRNLQRNYLPEPPLPIV